MEFYWVYVKPRHQMDEVELMLHDLMSASPIQAWVLYKGKDPIAKVLPNISEEGKVSFIALYWTPKKTKQKTEIFDSLNKAKELCLKESQKII